MKGRSRTRPEPCPLTMLPYARSWSVSLTKMLPMLINVMNKINFRNMENLNITWMLARVHMLPTWNGVPTGTTRLRPWIKGRPRDRLL